MEKQTKEKKEKNGKRGPETALLIVLVIIFALLIIAAGVQYFGFDVFYKNQARNRKIEEIKVEKTVTKADHPDVSKLNLEIGLGYADFTLADKQAGDKIFTSEAVYNYSQFEPELLEVYSDEAYLTYKLKNEKDFFLMNWNDVIARYNLYLTDPQLPTKVNASLGAGSGRVELGRNTLESLGFSLGSGRLDLMLQAPNRTTGSLDVNVGAGTAELEGLAYLNPSSIRAELGAGSLVLDFSGDTDGDLVQKNIPAEIKGGSGEMEIRLPDNYGYSLEYKTGVGNIKLNGENKFSGTGSYRSTNYDAAEFKVDFNVTLGAGNLRLEARE